MTLSDIAPVPEAPGEFASDPQPCGWGRDLVQKFAADAALKLGYKPGASLEPIVGKLGGRVEVVDAERVGTTGSLSVEEPGKFVINLSPLSGARRHRFTIAHEIGHYMLHSRLGALAPLKIRRDDTGPLEWEANWFAAGFLMPEKEFRERFAWCPGNAYLAQYFDVSPAAVEVRRKSLGL